MKHCLKNTKVRFMEVNFRQYVRAGPELVSLQRCPLWRGCAKIISLIFLRNDTVRLREVSALEDVRFREVSLYLYPLEVYNLELRFSQNVIQNGCFSLSFLAACRITLSAISPDSLRATYFPGTTKPILATIVLLEHVPLKVHFCFLNLCILK